MHHQEIHVVVSAICSQDLISAHDHDVPGTYAVSVRGVGIGEVADVALDSFHLAIAVEYPENFEFVVFNANTRLILEPAGIESGKIFDCTKILEEATSHF